MTANLHTSLHSTLIDELAQDRQEWSAALDSIQQEYGDEGVRDILRALQNHALARGVVLSEATLNTPYINTIPVSEQPVYPGDIELEKKIENIIRWNAMAMVLRGQDQGTGVVDTSPPTHQRLRCWKLVSSTFSEGAARATVAIW